MMMIPLAAAALLSGPSLTQRTAMLGAMGVSSEAQLWFEQARPHCTPSEASTWIVANPAPADEGSPAWLAACLALSGDTDGARAQIESMSHSDHGYAAHVLFEVGHPVAEAGKTAIAGPLMDLVLTYNPDHTTALYHAGMARFAGGDIDGARSLLRRFVQSYDLDDDWRSRAMKVLGT